MDSQKKIRIAKRLIQAFDTINNLRGATMAEGIVEWLEQGKPLTASQYAWFRKSAFIQLNQQMPEHDNEPAKGVGRPKGSKNKTEPTDSERIDMFMTSIDSQTDALVKHLLKRDSNA